VGDALGFARPWILWALPFIVIGFGIARARALKRDRIAYPPLQYHATPTRSWLEWLRFPAELALMTVLCIALAEPYTRRDLTLTTSEGIDVVLVLDISLSMLAEDFPPTRIDALRAIAADFVSRAGSHRVGVIAFAADAFTQSPLTTNQNILKSLLDGVRVHALNQNLSGGTAIGTALLAAAEVLERSKIEGRDQAVILITDGESNRGPDPTFAARYLRELGVRSYLIGVGGTEPVQVFYEGNPVGDGEDPYLAVLDDAQLMAIAEAADGEYVRASERDALEEVFSHLARLEAAPLEARQVEIRRGASSPLAWLALPLFVAYLLFGGVWLRRPFR